MNRQDKITFLSYTYRGLGVNDVLADQLAKEVLDELFPPLGPIERDESYDRDYIPMPGGYEVQTKGEGSTFRIANREGRMAFGPTSFEREFLTEMAYAMRKAYGE